MKLLFLNGPNLNMLGIREPDIYGRQTYAALEDYIRGFCRELGIDCEIFQSNHLSDVSRREDFRQVSYVRLACCRTFAGYGFEGYRLAAEHLLALKSGVIGTAEE